MSNDEIERYLSAALDQEACKATLLAALHSRVSALQQTGILPANILTALENLLDDPWQLNDDVIEMVIVEMLTGSQ